MKYFSVSFSLDDKDYAYYNKASLRKIFITRCKKMIIPMIFLVALGFFYGSVSFFVYSLILYSLTGIIIPQLTNKEFMKKNKSNSRFLQKETIVDFYSDYLVVRNESDSKTKSYSLRHYGFDTVCAVEENEEYISFLFSTNNFLIIPKRVLSDENFSMIKNLIENLFSNIYINQKN